jgi:heme exporter protein B
MALIGAALLRDLRLVARRKTEVLAVLVFFLVVTSLFPLAVGPESTTLSRIGPGVIWVAALLSTLLGLGRLFSSDYADGTLEQMSLAPAPLITMILGKIAAHWIVCGLPLVVLSPLVGLQYGLPNEALAVMALTLLMGTPILSALGAIGAALTLGVRGGGALIGLMVLPLYSPVLIFGSGAVSAVISAVPVAGHFYLMAAMLIVTLVVGPLACVCAIRIALE